jgi:hypothetical protein
MVRSGRCTTIQARLVAGTAEHRRRSTTMPTERGPAFIRVAHDTRLPLAGFLDQAGAVTFLLSASLGYTATLEKAIFIPDTTGAGAGASQNIQIRRGNATGTALITNLLLTLANHVLGGAGISAVVAPAQDAQARLGDADTFSITKDAGTVFSAGGGILRLIFRQRLQGRI